MSESPEAISQRPSPIKIWLLAARPRTLPAGVAPVLVGTALAAAETSSLRVGAFIAALLGAVFIQVGANCPTTTPTRAAAPTLRTASGPCASLPAASCRPSRC